MNWKRTALSLVVAAFAPVALHSCASASEKGEGGGGLILKLDVRMGADDFVLCASVENNDRHPRLITRPFSFLQFEQLYAEYSTPEGLRASIYAKGYGQASSAPPIHLVSNPLNYFLLDQGTRLSTCKSMAYGEFSEKAVVVQARFISWLHDNQSAPFTEAEVKAYGPLLTNLTVLKSNRCTINIEKRTSDCGL